MVCLCHADIRKQLLCLRQMLQTEKRCRKKQRKEGWGQVMTCIWLICRELHRPGFQLDLDHTDTYNHIIQS